MDYLNLVNFRFLELIHLLNMVFHTKIFSTAAEMLRFEDFAV